MRYLVLVFFVWTIQLSAQSCLSSFTEVYTFNRTNGEYIAQYGDVNADGQMDFLTQDNSRVVRVYLNNGSGFSASGSLQLPAYGNAVVFKDFDNDGKLDILSNSPDFRAGTPKIRN